ncbi:hypothetical protein [Candidatus Cyanaurora vandensis]|uniref:hypothetical protein n=1 Tax=Candidatus Cyanaurora vandensis TaxID=2714958 RepID=UPI00257F7BD0|nr:hypothetical protein [Candidatus Cyanaurora vandensis]
MQPAQSSDLAPEVITAWTPIAKLLGPFLPVILCLAWFQFQVVTPQQERTERLIERLILKIDANTGAINQLRDSLQRSYGPLEK